MKCARILAWTCPVQPQAGAPVLQWGPTARRILPRAAHNVAAGHHARTTRSPQLGHALRRQLEYRCRARCLCTGKTWVDVCRHLAGAGRHRHKRNEREQARSSLARGVSYGVRARRYRALIRRRHARTARSRYRAARSATPPSTPDCRRRPVLRSRAGAAVRGGWPSWAGNAGCRCASRWRVR